MKEGLDLQRAAATAQARLGEGADRGEVLEALTAEGWTEAEAARILDRIELSRSKSSPAAQEKVRSGYKNLLGMGVTTLGLSLGFTLWSISHSRDGSFWFAWAGILVGLFWLIQGLVGWARS
jgi:hypothetical protein